MLAYIVAAVGLLIVTLGVFVVAMPSTMRDLVRSAQQTRSYLYAAIGFRLGTGLFFIFASEACSRPQVIGTLGVIMLAAGFIGLFMGVERIQAMTDWFLALSDTAFRLWAPGAIAFGGLIVYAAL